MALTKVTKSGITNNAIDADKLEDGTILAADITPGTITADKLDSTLNLSSKTVTLPNTSVTNAMLAGSIANAKLANSSLTINGSSVSLGSSISAGALDWQAVITADGSTTTTGVAGRGYFINTTNAAHTFTLPSSPTIGDTIAIIDYAGTFATNKLTIARNGNNIQGVANNSQIGTNRASVTLVYTDATKGWVYANESNVADLQENLFVQATGGTVTTSGNFKIHTFTGDGSFVVSEIGPAPSNGDKVDYLVVAGGGGGGVRGGANSGGGGAGGYRTTFPSPGCNAGSFPITATTFPVTVGGGGGPGANGSNSVFSTITSTGGGRGGQYGQPTGGQPGGSGGGTSQNNPGTAPPVGWTAGTGNSPPVSPPQGNPGGSIYTSNPAVGNWQGGGGGGGASCAGAVQINTPNDAYGRGGAGGAGSTNSISGSPVTYAGGGGGSSHPSGGPSGAPLGGPGGGGNGASGPSGAGGTGTANSGGGGGGGGCGGVEGSGGSGIVIIRYKFQ